MDTTVLLVAGAVDLGMLLGEIPGLALAGALSAVLANDLLVGSIANLIVVDQAARLGVRIS